jgi:hypothetical protein
MGAETMVVFAYSGHFFLHCWMARSGHALVDDLGRNETSCARAESESTLGRWGVTVYNFRRQNIIKNRVRTEGARDDG